MRGIGAVLGAAAAFGAVSVLARRAYATGADPLPLLGARLLVAALVLGLAALAMRPRRPRTGELVLSAVAGLAFAGAGLGEFEALARATAPTVVVIVFVAPAWIALADRLLGGRKLGRARSAALAALAAGLALLVAAPGSRSPDIVAVLLALGASLMSAAFFLILGAVARTVSAAAAACVAAWAGAAAVASLDPAGVGRVLLSSDTAALGAAIGVLTALALVLLASGAGRSSALVASAVICVEPVVAAALSWLLLGELLAPAQAGGAAIVVAAVAVLARVSAREPPEHAATGRTRPRPRGSRPPPRPARTAPHRRSGGHSPAPPG
jgi:drug/metabolite transporter (DMT)-like permease